MNIIDFIFRIIDIKEDSIIIYKKLKTIKSYIIKLIIIEYL